MPLDEVYLAGFLCLVFVSVVIPGVLRDLTSVAKGNGHKGHNEGTKDTTFSASFALHSAFLCGYHLTVKNNRKGRKVDARQERGGMC